MSDAIISIENLSKRYLIKHRREKGDGLRHLLEDAIRHPFRWFQPKSARNDQEHFWALNGISFDVKQGQVLGIIGRNGAGKSTLLKILSRITEPTKGIIRLKGRVASLLEVGTGFHQELTGRENIFLNGAILGMTRIEILRKFDEIVEFSGVEKFLDTPVKRFSSGMYVRLAFAVAAHLEPEILIIDEVLAVGDAAFQKKCLGKMGEVSKEGRTVIFVSHNMGIVSALCQRIIFLERGKIALDGHPQTVIPAYLRNEAIGAPVENVRSANGRVTLIRTTCQDSDGQPRIQFHTGEAIDVVIEFEVSPGPGSIINPVVEVCDEFDNSAFSTSNFNEKDWYARETPPGRYRTVCKLPKDILNDRSYTIFVLLVEHLREALVRVPVVQLDIVDSGQFRDIYNGPIGGYLRPLCKWETAAVN